MAYIQERRIASINLQFGALDFCCILHDLADVQSFKLAAGFRRFVQLDQAARAAGHDNVRPGFFDVLPLLVDHPVGNLRVIEEERARAAAADIGVFHLAELAGRSQ